MESLLYSRAAVVAQFQLVKLSNSHLIPASMLTFVLSILTPALAQDGLYATLQTSMGDIRIRLHYDQAPRTVANFLTLAEGTRAWVDAPAGRSTLRPLYDGVIFHRVITNFMIQTGSPTGTGSGGPGFSFSDEFHSNLTHSSAGVVSMANSGPDSNGSQFFITVAATPWLDNVHSVFGMVTQGLNVAIAISGVATISNKPVTPVYLNNILIEKIGVAAQGFDPATVFPPLPVVHSTNAVISHVGGRPAISWNWHSNCVYSVYATTTLQSETNWSSGWSGTASGLYIDSIVASTRTAFFRLMEVTYSE